MPAETRERIMATTAELFRRRGYNGTGLKQIVAEASAPFGSLYHFFPGGKVQLGEEVIRWSGGLYGQLIDSLFDPAPDVETAIAFAFHSAGETLVETDYADACPIATVALEVASTNETLRVTTHEVFESWLANLHERFVSAGLPAERARTLSQTLLMLLEGAFILCRAARTTEAMAAAGDAAVAEVRRAFDAT
ncbi:TetR/AcrR family transcriptional regulator [Tenggerimyces flavus]|uniref:TetR/AcrR family transcriptional regulator n=1 Tax=Tenggerimyces flavus TaxID=1708749 RepID=A0ABV7YH41_9ACTN|nr:TetR/AcrR family transcriptional regulator [Tenggerimyces flavus]MBM7784123.1 AcrR family transcriptional regulator [Tenggerimyces flavus]